MMFSILVTDPFGSPVTRLTTMQLDRWSKRVNASGRMGFSFDRSNAEATETNLRLFNRMILLYGETRIWSGYLEDVQQIDERIECNCSGMLELFTKRWTGNDESFATDPGSKEAMDLLDGYTGVSRGIGSVGTIRNVVAQGSITVLDAWTLLAKAHSAEFRITDDLKFDFIPSLGSDRTDTVFTYRPESDVDATLDSISVGYSGKDMANKLTGVSSAGYEYTYDDAASQAVYGVIHERKAYNEARDLATVTAMATADGKQRSSPLTSFSVAPSLASRRFNVATGMRETKGLDPFSLSVGDTITVRIETANRSIEAVKRIAEMAWTMGDEAAVRLELTLSEPTVFLSAGYLEANRLDDATRRIKYLESLV